MAKKQPHSHFSGLIPMSDCQKTGCQKGHRTIFPGFPSHNFQVADALPVPVEGGQGPKGPKALRRKQQEQTAEAMPGGAFRGR
jgi:hypothetical protein